MANLLQRLVGKLRGRREQGRERPLAKIIRLGVTYADQLSFLLAAVGLLGLLLLPLQDRWVKFDEKALMVNSVRATFSDFTSLTHGRSLAEEVLAKQYARQPGVSLAQLVQQHMQRVGLDAQLTYTCSADDTHFLRNTSVVKGAATARQQGQGGEAGWNCVTVHGVLRAPQTDGSEALLVVTPVALTKGEIDGQSPYWDAPAAGAPLLLGSILALMHHLRDNVAWLSRDVVWVVPDARCGATASLAHWAQTYHGTIQGRSQSGVLLGGILQQALVLQADRVDITTAAVQVMGFDGLLPKLDTYNVLKELLWLFQDVRLQDLPNSLAAEAVEQLLTQHKLGGPALQQHVRKLGHMMSFMWQQLLGLPSGPHAALKTFMIDAATARFSGQSPPPADPEPGAAPPALPAAFNRRAAQMAQYAEASLDTRAELKPHALHTQWPQLVLHAFNNLDERFHHSFFLYLLTDRARFVAVEMYIVPLVALIATLILKAAKQRDHLRREPISVVTAQASAEDKKQAATEPAVAAPAASTAAANTGQQAAGNAGQQHHRTAGDVVDGIWGPAALVAALVIAASSLSGVLLREMVCPACRLCTHSIPTGCCSASCGLPAPGQRQQCLAGEQGQWPAAGNSALATPMWMLRLLPNTFSSLGRWEFILCATSVVLAAVALGWEGCVMIQHASRSQPAGDDRTGQQGKGNHLQYKALRAAMRVAILSSTAIMLTGMASVNWALAYGVAASLALLVVLGQSEPVAVPGNATTRGHGRKLRLLRMALLGVTRGIAIVGSSPAAHMLLLAMPAAGASHHMLSGITVHDQLHAWHAVLQHALCCSRLKTYIFWLAAYVPCWMLEAWHLIRPA